MSFLYCSTGVPLLALASFFPIVYVSSLVIVLPIIVSLFSRPFILLLSGSLKRVTVYNYPKIQKIRVIDLIGGK